MNLNKCPPRLDKLMEERGLSLEELSKAAGASPAYVKELLLNADKVPVVVVLTRIADCFGVTIDEMIKTIGGK